MTRVFSANPTLSAAGAPRFFDPRAPRRGPQLVHLPTWSQLSIATRQRGPVGHGGGDFFEIIQHREGHVSTLLADVCGNGPSAAVPVSRLRWLVRQHLACGETPGAVLKLLNESIVAGNEPDLFVTAVCVQVDPQTGVVTAASAGHLGPFIKRADGDAHELLMDEGAALGIMPAQSYAETRLDLEPEDALVLVTDGITDPLGTASSPLGQAGLLAELALARPSAESICAALLNVAQPSSDRRLKAFQTSRDRDGVGRVRRELPHAAEHDATVVVLKLPRRHRRITPVRRATR